MIENKDDLPFLQGTHCVLSQFYDVLDYSDIKDHHSAETGTSETDEGIWG